MHAAEEAFDRLFRSHEATSQELSNVGKQLDKLIELLSERIAPAPVATPTPAPAVTVPLSASLDPVSPMPSAKMLPSATTAASVPVFPITAAPSTPSVVSSSFLLACQPQLLLQPRCPPYDSPQLYLSPPPFLVLPLFLVGRTMPSFPPFVKIPLPCCLFGLRINSVVTVLPCKPDI